MCLYCSYMENNKGIRIVFLKYKEWNVIVERCITGQYLKRTDLVWGKILLILMNLYGEQLSLFEKLEIRLRFHVSFFFHSFKNYNTMISFLITIICKIVADLLRGTPFQPRSFTNVSSNMIFTFFEGMLWRRRGKERKRKKRGKELN